ncbi:MAG TPA: hypothetical protein DGH68_12315, partial [Bacteroidetes bacterium]|nr:hypothetical protein [Bacteroidota bacterium]
MKTALSIIIAALLMFAISCKDSGTVPDPLTLQHNDLGNMLLKFDSAPEEITTVLATLSRPGHTNRTLQMSVTDSSATGSFEAVPVGSWHLKVDARDSAGVVRFSGETDVNVLPRSTSNVSLQLQPTSGRIVIVVTWGGTAQNPTHLLYYPFNCNANDESGHNHNGLVSGATLAPDRAGAQNRAYAFDGWDNHIEMPDLIPDTIASFSVSAWVYTSTITGRRIAVYTGANKGESVLQTWNSDFSFQINDGITYYEARTPAMANRFVHLVGVYERGRHLQIWLDGVLRTQTPIPFTRLYSGRTTHHSSVGSYAPLWLDWGRQNCINSW